MPDATACNGISNETVKESNLERENIDIFSRLVKKQSKLLNEMNISSKIAVIEEIKKRMRQVTPGNPACNAWKCFSQFEEDGIIHNCFKKMEVKGGMSKTFVEMCCGDGLENNTLMLLLEGYRGIWLDGSDVRIGKLKKNIGGLSFKNLEVMHVFITLKNLKDLIDQWKDLLNSKDIDVMSLDVDGNDIYFAKEIATRIAPKLFVVEYNAKFPPPLSYSISYNPKHTWSRDDYHGASLQKFMDELHDYTLVSCSIGGVNAFFVRNDYAPLFDRYNIKELYQPPMLFLRDPMLSGRPTSYKWLTQALVEK